MITILGTSHVSPDSVRTLAKLIKRKDCVCVELDPIRYQALRQKDTRSPPGIFPKILHSIQQRLGRSTGVLPGEEMLTAVTYARGAGVPVYLIDQDIRVTLARLNAVPLVEKLSLVVPLIVAPHGFDVKRVPSKSMISTALRGLCKAAPTMYSVLVTERNAYMASWIIQLSQQHRNVLVVVGAAHAKGLEKLLKDEHIKVRII
ncbi:MAG: TraB/GumN family protein [Candidatus Aenigmarchaeota archaeon]|nr:TraB/GumN family protein [Candidatus Aenigmarchaeota archaeon]